MSNKDILPQAEELFNEWQQNFSKVLSANVPDWGIPLDAVDGLNKLKQPYEDAYAVANKGKSTTRTSQQVKAKRMATAAYKDGLRLFIRQYLAFNEKVTDDERVALKITVRDGSRTRSSAPVTIPDHFCEPLNAGRIRITVRQQPSADGRSRRGKPDDAGAIDLAIWVGPNCPASPDDIPDKRRFTRSPITLEFDYTDAGKTMICFARWVGKGQQLGRWTEAIEEVITK